MINSSEKSSSYILSLDLGTTGNRAILFDEHGNIVAQAYKELTQYYPQLGWVEHDPREILLDTCWAMKTAVQKAEISPQQILALGLTVQRETCVLWDKSTGRPLYNAIVWQDRRTAALCQHLAEQGYVEEIYDRTGLVLDAYFSASKLRWLLDHVAKEEPPLEPNNVLAGTIDTWMLWNLTGGTHGGVHATDDSNASRTLLYNLKTHQWDDQLLQLFGIPRTILPTIQPSVGYFGHLQKDILGVELPIMAMFGDQQASLFAHGCDRPGLLKCTYGTGCFLVAHTGQAIARSQNRLLSTIAWTTPDAEAGYALEGSMFTAGACIQWLRDGLKLITAASDAGQLAAQVSTNGGVYFVPALSGLGTPHWDMTARGAFLGLTAAAQREHLVRSVLEAIAYQVREVVEAINQDSGTSVQCLKVDGGACQSDFLMQFQADVLGIPVERPAILDATAQGAAFAAGLAAGLWDSYATLVSNRTVDRTFEPSPHHPAIQEQYSIWQKAVERSKHWA